MGKEMGGLKKPLLADVGDHQAKVVDDGVEMHPGQRPVAVDLLFVKRVWGLMVMARAGGALVLVILSIISVVIVSRAGLVIGRFYLALINKDMELLWNAIQLSLLWYGAESICSAVQVWTAELLALQWRRNLTEACHRAYLTGPNLCALNSPGQIVDNPDERVAQELYNFSQSLAQFMLKTIASPLMILYYTWWVWKYVGWYGPVTVYLFFTVGATVTRWIISPIAGLVARQEKLEAFFRISHVRVRKNAESIAMYDSGSLEQTELDSKLESVLQNQRKLVTRHFLLDFSTKAYSYLGSILNYCVVGLAVFGGRYDKETSGDVASMISNASFSVLQLIFSFTQIIETAKMVSDLAGFTVRVAELFEALDLLPQVSATVTSTEIVGSSKKTPPQAVKDKSSEGTWMRSLKGEWVQQDLAEYLVVPPSDFILQEGRLLEFCVHFSPPEIQQMFAEMFPDIDPGTILVITTFQQAAMDLWPAACAFYDSNETSPGALSFPEVWDEMNTMLSLFLAWQHEVTYRLKSLGYWADAIHPLTGLPLSAPSRRNTLSPELHISDSTVLDVSDGLKYRQVDAAYLLLGYSSTDVGCCKVVMHPKFGTRSFPASVLTGAPVGVLQTAMQSVREFYRAKLATEGGQFGRDFNIEETSVRQQSTVIQEDVSVALLCANLTLNIPRTQQLVIRSLSMKVRWGESLLITGPTGSGKTSLLRAIGGIWPLETGSVWIPPRLGGKGVLFIPQTPLLVKGGLAAQISYPVEQNTSSEASVIRLQEALQAVGMTYLLEKVKHDWQMDVSTETLSPGEQQSLALARVLYHRPQLAILDEATSALNKEAEDHIYNRVMQLGITVVSVAHRQSLFRYHAHVLNIPGDGKGSWTLHCTTQD